MACRVRTIKNCTISAVSAVAVFIKYESAPNKSPMISRSIKSIRFFSIFATSSPITSSDHAAVTTIILAARLFNTFRSK